MPSPNMKRKRTPARISRPLFSYCKKPGITPNTDQLSQDLLD